MDKLVEEYKSILNSDALSSDKYWSLRKKIYEDYKSPGVLARDVSRSNMFTILLGLLHDQISSFFRISSKSLLPYTIRRM